MLTCYDHPTAVALDEVGVDVLLVGDSVGTNVLGYSSETEVTLDDIAHHVGAVARGGRTAFVLADLPHGTYGAPEQALASAARLRAAGADGVKLEGPHLEVVARLTEAGHPVCGHLGLTPQTIEKKAVQGKTAEAARRILADARALEAHGAVMLVLELVPEELGRLITESLTIPTIGIGAGRFTSGQVLVIQDLLGITPRSFRHNKRYAEIGETTRMAVRRYIDDVEAGIFPTAENASHLAPDVLQALLQKA